MIPLRLCRNMLIRLMVVLVVISCLAISTAFCQEAEDSQVFISGFNAYQQKNYASAIEKMNEVLLKYPETPLRDMALFWLSRSYFKVGNQQDAARYLSQFAKEYPESPLKATVEEELLSLTARYERGEKLSAGTVVAKQADLQAAQKAKAEKELLEATKVEEAARAAATEAARTAAEEAARVAAVRQAEEKAAAEKKEQERLAVLKAEEERIALEKAAAEKREQERLAALKAEDERIALEKASAEKKELERLAALKAEEGRIALEKAAAEKREQERLAALKAEEERIALAKAASEKAEQDRLAAEKAEEARQASLAAEATRIAALKAEEDRKVAEKAALDAENVRKAAARAEEQRMAQQRAAEEKAEQERRALAKAEEAKRAALAAELVRIAALKAEEDRRIAEKAALDAESARKAEERRLAQQRVAEEKLRSEKAALREKAIAQYKSIIDKYPSSAAAASSAAKLRELGIAVALPPKAAAVEAVSENAQVLRLEVAQFAGFEFNLLARPGAYKVASRVSVPFEIINRGNGNDSFYLESGFPASFSPGFAAAATPDVAINQTPVMAPGETFKGVVNIIIPAASIDGLRVTHPVKAASRFMAEASQSREVVLTASAPLLRAVLKTDKTQPLPGEKVVYRIAVLNVGSTAAENVTFRISFPPQLEPINHTASGFRQEMKSTLILDSLQVSSGESKEFSVAFQLKEDSLAGQEISTRAELINNQLKTATAFVSNMAYVQPQRGISVRSGPGRIVVIPGQTISVPFVVTNTGNVREKLKIASSVKGAQDAVIYHDINRDGIKQASEPVISEIGPLAPKEEAGIVVEIKTPKTADDGSEGSVLISFRSEGESSSSASGLAQLVYSRPVLQMAMAGHDGRLKPGDVASIDLTITNKGSNLARVVELKSAWPEQLELVATDPANSLFSSGNMIWRFKEMGAAEKRVIKVSFRVKPGTIVGTNIQLKSVMTYEDQLGNRY